MATSKDNERLLQDLFYGSRKDEINLTLDELHDLVERAKETEIPLDKVNQFIWDLERDINYAELTSCEQSIIATDMKDALDRGDYQTAFDLAQELRSIDYPRYKNIIDYCCSVCADNNVGEALILFAEQYIDKRDAVPKPEAFPYLKKLSDRGYVKYIGMLAECYHDGIGCEINLPRSADLYFEAALFTGEQKYYKALKQKDVKESFQRGGIWTKLYDDVAGGEDSRLQDARVKIADMILNRELKEYEDETAVFLLERTLSCYSGIEESRYGECLLRGRGIERDLDEAEHYLEYALIDIDSILECIEKGDDDVMGDYYSAEDYIKERQRVKDLLQEKKDEEDEFFWHCANFDYVVEKFEERKALQELEEMEGYKRLTIKRTPCPLSE